VRKEAKKNIQFDAAGPLERCDSEREIFGNDNLKKVGWSYGYVSAVDSEGRTIWIVEAHRSDGKRFVVHADEKLSAFLELESASRESHHWAPMSRRPEQYKKVKSPLF
jgi:hypothetical protein